MGGYGHDLVIDTQGKDREQDGIMYFRAMLVGHMLVEHDTLFDC